MRQDGFAHRPAVRIGPLRENSGPASSGLRLFVVYEAAYTGIGTGRRTDLPNLKQRQAMQVCSRG